MTVIHLSPSCSYYVTHVSPPYTHTFLPSSGSNIYCLDKNYGGVLILWDRLFGTYQTEKPGEEVVYGILMQPQKYNPLFHQVSLVPLFFFFFQCFLSR